MTTHPHRTCIVCGQPGATYLVTWTLNQSGPPTNIYAHPGPCAQQANRTYCTPAATIGSATINQADRQQPQSPIPNPQSPHPRQLTLLPP